MSKRVNSSSYDLHSLVSCVPLVLWRHTKRHLLEELGNETHGGTVFRLFYCYHRKKRNMVPFILALSLADNKLAGS